MEILRKENYEVQTTFNEDSIEVLCEDAQVENVDAEEVEGIGAEGGFTKRTAKPGAGNKFYITDNNGGWSWCIKGHPTDKDCDVLANCVGMACGRFNEIYAEVTNYAGMRFPTLNCNAENFIERAREAGLEIVDHPVLGGIMVWQKGRTLSGSDGAGHVEVVEDIYNKNDIYDSASAYGGSKFYNARRNNNNGRWGMGSSYTFRGCIINPAIGNKGWDDEPTPEPTPTPTPVEYKFKEGDKVIIEGLLYPTSNTKTPTGNTSRKVTNITRVAKGALHPYNTTGDLGWMDEFSITKYEEPTPEPTPEPTEIKEGDIVTVNGSGNAASTGTSRSWTRNFTNRKMKVIMIAKGRPYPYACNQYGEGTVGRASDVTGWFSENSVTK